MNKNVSKLGRNIGETTKVTAEQVADVFRELESERVIVNEEPTMYRDAEGVGYIGHKVEYQGEEYFVLPALSDGEDETVFQILKLDKRNDRQSDYTIVNKVYYDISDILDLTETKEDFIAFVKYNFVNWLG